MAKTYVVLAAKIDITNHSVFEEENNETFVGSKQVISMY